jgi:hypothetical protein
MSVAGSSPRWLRKVWRIWMSRVRARFSIGRTDAKLIVQLVGVLRELALEHQVPIEERARLRLRSRRCWRTVEHFCELTLRVTDVSRHVSSWFGVSVERLC